MVSVENTIMVILQMLWVVSQYWAAFACESAFAFDMLTKANQFSAIPMVVHTLEFVNM